MSAAEPATVEAPEHHGHAAHGTGVRWLDMTLALAALMTSIVSLYLAMQHGHDMARLVEANSLPYLQLYSSDLEADYKQPAFRLSATNQGVGPARIAEVQVTVDGQPVRNFNALLDRCCAPGLLAAVASGRHDYPGIGSNDVILSTLRDRMIRPGESVDFIDWKITPASTPVASKLAAAYAAGRLKVSACFCSVFEDCWTRGLNDRRPSQVRDCPRVDVPYVQ